MENSRKREEKQADLREKTKKNSKFWKLMEKKEPAETPVYSVSKKTSA